MYLDYLNDQNQQNPYATQQPSQQGGQQGVDPLQAYQMYQNFSGAGATGGAEAGGASGAGGGLEMASVVNPWTALAAGIVGNEREGIRGGYRADDNLDYAKDLLTGSVAEQDWSQRFSPKIFGSDDPTGLGSSVGSGFELMSGDVGGSIDKMQDGIGYKAFDETAIQPVEEGLKGLGDMFKGDTGGFGDIMKADPVYSLVKGLFD